MARYKISWRNILFNLPAVIMAVQTIRDRWPDVREELKKLTETSSASSAFVDIRAALDLLANTFAERK